jgi:hypothetical protein
MTSARGGRNAQFPLQYRGTPLVGPYGTRSVAGRRVQPDQRSVSFFPQRIMPNQDFSMTDRGPMVVGTFLKAEQLGQSFTVAMRQPLPLNQHPLLIPTDQEVTTICRDRGTQIRKGAKVVAIPTGGGGSVNCRLKAGDIKVRIIRLAPGQPRIIQNQIPVNIRECPAKLMNCLTKIGASLLFRRIGPEHRGEMVTPHGAGTTLGENREKGLRSMRDKRGGRLSSIEELELTEQ